jgi:hypothetical protein
MNSLAYQLPQPLIMKNWHKPRFMRDGSVARREALNLEVLVESGDYFVTVATKLDTISYSTSDYNVRLQLEDLVSDLIYLQDNYRISKNEQSEPYGPSQRTCQDIQGGDRHL